MQRQNQKYRRNINARNRRQRDITAHLGIYGLNHAVYCAHQIGRLRVAQGNHLKPEEPLQNHLCNDNKNVYIYGQY